MSFFASRPASRQCRVFQTRTQDCVTRALQTWSRIFESPLPPIDLDFTPTCSGYAKKIKQVISDCPSKDQSEIMAWQSIKKLLPDSCRCMEKTMLEDLRIRLSRSARQLPKGFLQFAHNETVRVFRRGWDLGLYEDHVLTTSPPLSSTTECPRSKGGALGSGIDHSSFLDVCLRDSELELDRRAKMIVVQSAGKPRALSKFSADTLCLRPLHKAIYDRMSKQEWINRGDVTTDGLSKAGFDVVDGEVLTSGDYKSATDNLSIEAAEAILAGMLSTAVSVPQSVKRAAMSCLRPELYNLEENIDFSPSIGQMMGSYLSFPLLCMQNRIAFLWAGGGDRPCKINGDDILFRSDPEFSQRWMDTVSLLGLEVERTKTSVSKEFGSLNSTLIARKGSRYVVRQTLRFGMLRECGDVTSLCKTFECFLAGIQGPTRFRAGMEFFRWHLPTLKSYRTTTWELGFRGDLAWRLTRKWDLPFHRPTECLPRLGPDHNVVVPREGCTFVDPGSLTREDRKTSARELAAWKFGVEYESLARRSELSFKLKMSLIRPDRPDFSAYTSGFGESSKVSRPSWAETRRWFAERRVVRRETFPLMIEPEEVLPPYSDHAEGSVLIDVGEFNLKK